jgi:aspartate aminotransferase
MSLIANRLKRIKPSPTLVVTSKAAELRAKGLNVIGLGAGEPDFDTPENIKEAAIASIRNGATKYTAVEGTIELRKAICQKFKRENNLDYQPNNIIVGCGAKHVLYNAIMASVNPGDEVIIPAPYWVSYPDIVELAEGTPVIINCKSENNFLLTPGELEASITPKTKWLILNSPSNPTGNTYSYENLRALADILLKYPQVNILSDDIYEHITFEGFKFYTIAQIEPKLIDRVLTLNGVSKSYAMTGWRIGFAGGPAELIKAMSVIQSQNTTNACSISQAAAVEALNGPQDFIPQNAELFHSRRDLVLSLLSDVSLIKCNKPTGAFYIFIECYKMFGKKTPAGKLLQNSSDVAEYLLEDALVAVVQGVAFGMEGYFRISYATSEANLTEACRRIKEACEKLY